MGQLFQIHGNTFKPDPSGNGGQASVVCITHRVFLFRIRKDPFNGLFSLGINLLAQVGLSDALHNVQVFLPDVGCQYLLAFLICLTAGFGWAVDAVFGGAAVDFFSRHGLLWYGEVPDRGDRGTHPLRGHIGSPRDGILLYCLYILYRGEPESFRRLRSSLQSMGSYIPRPWPRTEHRICWLYCHIPYLTPHCHGCFLQLLLLPGQILFCRKLYATHRQIAAHALLLRTFRSPGLWWR